MNDKPVIGDWRLVSGPGKVTFSTTHDSVVTVTGSDKTPGQYIIQGKYNGFITTATINVK